MGGQGAEWIIKRVLRRLRGRSGTREQAWSIGLYSGASPCSLAPAPGVINPILTRDQVRDVPAEFVADPFMIRKDGSWYLFFEVMNASNGRGEIGLATSNNGQHWTYRQIVLAEPFHLSYPQVFEFEGAFYMLPEAWRSGGLRLYRSRGFPFQWECVATLMKAPRLADPTLFRHEGRWWLFVDQGPDFRRPELALFHAGELHGPWVAHPANPIVQGDPHTARPGGRVVSHEGRLIRFAQDVFPLYGKSVSAFEITQLSPTAYAERPWRETPVLAAGRYHWNNGGMHHLDAHELTDGRWLACVDGFTWET